jgi:hypothetical protein
MSPEELLNAFLQEFFVARFADPQSGNAEPFLLSFTFQALRKQQSASLNGSKDS